MLLKLANIANEVGSLITLTVEIEALGFSR